MGTICIIFTVLITAFILATGHFNDVVLNLTIPYTDINFEISFLVAGLIVFAMGIFSGVLLMLGSFFDAQSRYSKLKKQYDKTNLGADNAEDTIRLLENKIKTLETALDNALKK